MLNVVNGDKEAVDTILTDSRVKAELRRLDADRRVHLCDGLRARQARAGAGGAKNFAIVMPDADIGNAVNALMARRTVRAASGAWRFRSSSRSRRHGGAGRRRLKAEIAKMKVGPARRAGRHGPLVTRQHFEKVTGFVEAGIAAGATLVVDGRA
ncbi:hypothetical protein BMMON2_53400 [Burkholderia mallei]